jgi:hypothetical protein
MKILLPTLRLALAILAMPLQPLAQNALTRPDDDAVVVLITEQEAALASQKKELGRAGEQWRS